MVAAFGVIFGLFFFPTYDQVSLMFYYNKQYEKALERYEETKAKTGGNTPLSVAIPLSWTFLKFAETQQALQSVEDYVNENPQNMDAKIYLYSLYKETGKPVLAQILLRDIYQELPSKNALEDLLSGYLTDQDMPNLIWASQELIDKYTASPDQYTQLAYLYASTQKMDLALETIDKLSIKEKGKKWSIDNLNIAVSLYARNKEPQKVMALINSQMQLGLPLSNTIEMAYALLQEGMSQESLLILDQLQPDARDSLQVVTARINITMYRGDNKKTYILLKHYFDQGILPEAYTNDFLASALEKDNYDILRQILQNYPLKDFSEDVLVNLIVKAMDHRYPDLIVMLKHNLKTTHFNDTNFLASLIDISSIPDAEDPENDSTVPSYKALNNYQKYLLTRILFSKKYHTLAKKQLTSIESFTGFTAPEVTELGQLYLELGEQERGFQLIEKVREENGLENYLEPWLLLATATNHTEEVLKYLNTGNKIGGRLLKDLFYTAYKNKNGPLSVLVAEKIVSLSSKIKYREMLAEAYILNGDIARGVALFEVLNKENPQFLDHYIDILFLAAKKDPEYQSRLLSLVEDRLKEGSLTEKRKEELGYIYIEFKMNDKALPVFLELAQEKLYKSEDVQTLLGLFGQHPNSEAMAWILKRTEGASTEEKIQWINYLIDIQNPANAIAFITEDDLKSQNYQKTYLKAIDAMIYELSKASKKNPSLKSELRDWILKGLALKSVPKAKQREWAFALSDAGYKKDAIPIFFALAEHKRYKSDDVQNLLSLWGEKPPQDAIVWMEMRGRGSKGKEKAYWLKYLLDIKHPESVTALVTPEDYTYTAILDIYLDALSTLKKQDCLLAILSEIYLWEFRPKRLNHLGKVAQDANLLDLAIDIFNKLIGIDHKHINAHRALGALYFGKGALSISQYYLEQYLFLNPAGDYMSFYYLGEIFFTHKHYACSYPYFRHALLLSQKEKEHSIYLQSTQAQLYYRLRNHNMAISLYYDILQKAPNNINIRSDFGNMLIDLELWATAKCVLFDPTVEFLVFDGDENDVLNFTITQVRYLRDTVQPCRAIQVMDVALAENNTYPPLLAAKAELELSLGSWQNAQDYLTLAQEYNTLNEGFVKAWRDIYIAYQDFGALEGEYRETNVIQKEKFIRLWYEGFMNENTRFNLYVENDFLTLDSYLNLNGVTKSFKGYRTRLDLGFLQFLPDGQTFRGYVYLGDGLAGLGAKWTSPNYYGIWGLKAMYNKPCWEFVQSTIEYGSQDTIEVSYKPRLLPRWEGFSLLAYNKYNLHGLSRAASTVQAGGNLSYRFANYTPVGQLVCEDDTVILNYNLDAEYGLNNVERTNEEGISYFPLPFVSRENHALSLNVRRKFRDNLIVEAYGGYLYNRLAGRKLAPLYGGFFLLGVPGSFQMRVEYNHSVSTEVGGGTVDRYFFNLLYPFE
jgi:Tfp pilus assembly protein PilF